MADAWGVKCNVAEPRSQARTGALCWIINTNLGWSAERVEVLMRSRGGRLIRTWIAAKLLCNFRAAWMPEHLRDECRVWDAKEQAEAWAKGVNDHHPPKEWPGATVHPADGQKTDITQK